MALKISSTCTLNDDVYVLRSSGKMVRDGYLKSADIDIVVFPGGTPALLCTFTFVLGVFVFVREVFSFHKLLVAVNTTLQVPVRNSAERWRRPDGGASWSSCVMAAAL